MTHGSLFSGIGGFDLAASWMGWENVFQVENDKFCTKVLEKNFPNTKRYGDIKEFDGTKYRGAIDILTGGFPCQPYSSSGKRLGKADARHLWPENHRVIREIQPTYILGENVRGLLNWSGGLVFDEVQADLEVEGYEIAPFLLPASGINAWHSRDRIWIVAHLISNGFNSAQFTRDSIQWDKCAQRKINASNKTKIDTYLNSEGLQGRSLCGIPCKSRENRNQLPAGFLRPAWSDYPYQSPICRGNDGIPNRVHRIKSLGNAIVPQVAYEIFKAIEATLI